MSDTNKDAANEQLINQNLEQAADKQEDQSEALNRNLTTPGRMLRAGREKKELAISTVGKQLKLDVRVIEALERDEFDSIGAPVFVKGHLRKYASFVDISPDDVMLSYYQVARAQDATPVISQTMPMTDSRPKVAWLSKLLMGLVVLALIAALLYGLYRSWNWYVADAESSASHAIENVADDNLSLPNRDGVQTSNTSNRSVANNGTTGANTNSSTDTQTLSLPPQSGLSPSSTETVVNTNVFVNGADRNAASDLPSEPVTGQNSSNTNSVSTPPPTNQVQAETGDTLRLVFVENSWVNIKGNDDRSLMNGIGYQGDSREFVLKGDTEIHLGNADGVELFLNGNPYVVPRRARSGKTAHFELVPRQ